MSTFYGKLMSKGRTTVPNEVREALGIKSGDMLVYRIMKGRVTLARAEPPDRAYLKGLQSTLSEWNSKADAEAYDGLTRVRQSR